MTFTASSDLPIRVNGHVNISFLDAQKRNALVDIDREHGFCALAVGAIAGLCHHHRALTAIMAPTVKAYRRLQPAQLSGYWATWGVGLDDLEADTVFSVALGESLVENFVANKRSEWQRFTRAEGRFDGDDPITAWERHEYLVYH